MSTHVRRAYAKDTLVSYFAVLAKKAGLPWTEADRADLNASIDIIIEAAAEDAVQQMKEYQEALEEKP